jgi:hypothetical protein
MNRLRPDQIFIFATHHMAAGSGHAVQRNEAKWLSHNQTVDFGKKHRLSGQFIKQAGHADALSDEITQTRIGTSPLVSASIFAASTKDGEPRPFFHRLMVVRSLPIFAAKSSSLISLRFR